MRQKERVRLMNLALDKSNKKQAIKVMIEQYIEEMIELAENQGSLDHFELSISNHQGSLQMDCLLRDRAKAY